MNKKYRVTLTSEERLCLEQLLFKGNAAARKLTRARLRLKADAGPEGPDWTDDDIHQALEVGLATIARVRQAFVERGLQATLAPRPRYQHRARKLDGDQEAHLIALACSQPPPGRRCWTLRLLADALVDLGQVTNVSPETVRHTLNKPT